MQHGRLADTEENARLAVDALEYFRARRDRWKALLDANIDALQLRYPNQFRLCLGECPRRLLLFVRDLFYDHYFCLYSVSVNIGWSELPHNPSTVTLWAKAHPPRVPCCNHAPQP